MQYILCNNCGTKRGFKRNFGWGTFFAVLCTGGFWLLTLPFYPVRCIQCGMKSPKGSIWNRPIGGMKI